MFSANDGKVITLIEGSDLTEKYRDEYPGETKAVFIGANHIQSILDQTDCVGIRVYFARTKTGANTIVMVGAKVNESDIESGVVVNSGKMCPPSCSGGALDG